jgi:hypothetical protein
VTAMGCPECIEAAKEGQKIQPLCQTAGNELACERVNPGTSFSSGRFPDSLTTSGCSVQNTRLATSGCSRCDLQPCINSVGIVVLVFAALFWFDS